jgi:hypothetical protein
MTVGPFEFAPKRSDPLPIKRHRLRCGDPKDTRIGLHQLSWSKRGSSQQSMLPSRQAFRIEACSDPSGCPGKEAYCFWDDENDEAEKVLLPLSLICKYRCKACDYWRGDHGNACRPSHRWAGYCGRCQVEWIKGAYDYQALKDQAFLSNILQTRSLITIGLYQVVKRD